MKTILCRYTVPTKVYKVPKLGHVEQERSILGATRDSATEEGDLWKPLADPDRVLFKASQLGPCPGQSGGRQNTRVLRLLTLPSR